MGPNVTEPVQDPLAVLLLDNRLYMMEVGHHVPGSALFISLIPGLVNRSYHGAKNAHLIYLRTAKPGELE